MYTQEDGFACVKALVTAHLQTGCPACTVPNITFEGASQSPSHSSELQLLRLTRLGGAGGWAGPHRDYCAGRGAAAVLPRRGAVSRGAPRRPPADDVSGGCDCSHFLSGSATWAQAKSRCPCLAPLQHRQSRSAGRQLTNESKEYCRVNQRGPRLACLRHCVVAWRLPNIKVFWFGEKTCGERRMKYGTDEEWVG